MPHARLLDFFESASGVVVKPSDHVHDRSSMLVYSMIEGLPTVLCEDLEILESKRSYVRISFTASMALM